MKLFKKKETPVGQNKSLKTSQKHETNLRKNTTIYFQIGLILTLLASYGLFEMEFETNEYLIETVSVEEDKTFINAPIFKEELTRETVKQQTKPKQKLVNKIEEVPDDITIKSLEENIITEPELNPSDELNPGDVNIIEEFEDPPLPFNGIQKAPIYPGCEKFSKEDKRKQCFSDRVGKLVSRKFNHDLINETGLRGKQRVQVQFKIDKEGKVVDIKARALHPKLKNEAIKVIKKLPQMIPGQQNDRKAEVIYNLPILLKTQN